MQERYYRKLTIPRPARMIAAWMHTLERDRNGIWPVYEDIGLESCQVHTLRFDDPWLYAGWVIYTAALPSRALPLMLDWHYPAATLELYDLPEGCALYLSDGQEPGGYPAQPIGDGFARFAEYVAASLAIAPTREIDPDARMVALDPMDQLIVTWLQVESHVGVAQIARRLACNTSEVVARVQALGVQGWRFERKMHTGEG